MSVRVTTPYPSRPTRLLQLWEIAGWQVKVYGIRLGGDRPSVALVEEAKRCAMECLPQPSVNDTRYGAAILGVHQGRGYSQVFVDWWEDENELRHRTFATDSETSHILTETTHTGRAFCIWDLRVLAFERDAWVECVLRNPSGPDLKAYLGRRLEEIG